MRKICLFEDCPLDFNPQPQEIFDILDQGFDAVRIKYIDGSQKEYKEEKVVKTTLVFENDLGS